MAAHGAVTRAAARLAADGPVAPDVARQFDAVLKEDRMDGSIISALMPDQRILIGFEKELDIEACFAGDVDRPVKIFADRQHRHFAETSRGDIKCTLAHRRSYPVVVNDPVAVSHDVCSVPVDVSGSSNQVGAVASRRGYAAEKPVVFILH